MFYCDILNLCNIYIKVTKKTVLNRLLSSFFLVAAVYARKVCFAYRFIGGKHRFEIGTLRSGWGIGQHRKGDFAVLVGNHLCGNAVP